MSMNHAHNQTRGEQYNLKWMEGKVFKKLYDEGGPPDIGDGRRSMAYHHSTP